MSISTTPSAPPLLDATRVADIRTTMSRHVGVVRDETSLATASDALESIAGEMSADCEPSRRTWEAVNILTVAMAMVAAAQARTESRGCHRRSDHPEPRPEWVRHLDVTLSASDRTNNNDTGGPISVEERP